MKAAARLAARVDKLVLLETDPFYLLAQAHRLDASAKKQWTCQLREAIRTSRPMGDRG
jgi:hypothetical protein